MARGELLKKLFTNFNRGNGEEFRAAALEIIAEEERKRNFVLSKSLRRALEMAAYKNATPTSGTFHRVPHEADKNCRLLRPRVPISGNPTSF